MLTMTLALILIYLFSVLGFMFFRNDFLTNIPLRKNSIQYQRSNHLIKTTMLTRMSKIINRCSSFPCFCLIVFLVF
jgi:hypothetical protein